MTQLKKYYHLAYPGPCMHEFVLSSRKLKKFGVSTEDVAKRLLDYGLHAPTVYFPLIVKDALMIEPVETESKETLDYFAKAMREIAREAEETPGVLRDAPAGAPVGRLDETAAARKPNLSWPDSD